MVLCSITLVEHLELHLATLTTFDQMRAEVLKYVEARTSREQESTPMDVDSLDATTDNNEDRGRPTESPSVLANATSWNTPNQITQ